MDHSLCLSRFPNNNGTRQGSQLSPVLYILAQWSIWRLPLGINPYIPGMSMGLLQAKLSLSADDLLLYMTQTHIAILSILQKSKEFKNSKSLAL